MAYNEIQDMLIDAMINVVDTRLNEASFDKSVYVVVVGADRINNKYSVTYNGTTYTNLACEIGTLNIGDVTRMLISNNRRILIGNYKEPNETEYTAGNGITINDNQITAKVDGDTVFFNEDGELLAAGGGGATYYAGAGLNLDSTTHTFSASVDNDTIKVDSSNKLYVAKGGTTYTAGTNIDITNNVISATDTTYDLASDTKNGLMNHSHYSKLQGIAAGADKSNDGVLTIKLNGISKGTFTANQAGASTVELTDTTYTADSGIDITNNKIKTKIDGTTIKYNSSGQMYAANGGQEYEAGNGLQLTNNTFSIDELITATKNDLTNKQDKLTATGSSVQGIYINASGVPTAMSYKLNATVPSGAKFTDTTYTGSDGITLTGTNFTADTNVLATKTDLLSKQDKLTETGTATKGVYIDSTGAVKAMTYTLSKSVPSNAVFTDTTYSAGTNVSIDSNNKISATDTLYYAGMGLREDSNEFSVIGYVTQVLTTTTDFNDVLVNGVYECPAASSAETYHRPTKDYGILDVETTTDMAGIVLCVQTFHRASASYNESYIRRKYSSNDWGSWASIINKLGTGLKYLTISNNAVVDFDAVQAKLNPGTNITITENTISAKDTTYSDATTSTHGLMSTDDKTKLDNIEQGAQKNKLSNWTLNDTSADDYIKNKPTIPTAANDGKLTITLNGTSKGTFTANLSSNATIALTDTTYNNATTTTHGLMSTDDKIKLDDIDEHAQVNVQSDWDATSGDAYIKNKPTIPAAANDGILTITQNGTSKGTFSANASSNKTIALTDTTYSDATTSVHGLMSTSDKIKLDSVDEGALKNKLSDWEQTSTTADDYIKNKPTIPEAAKDGILTVTLNGTSVGTFSANQSTDNTIALTDTTYTAAEGIQITSSNSISIYPDQITIGCTKDNKILVLTDTIATKADLTNKQDKLTAGNNITISGQTISATDTTYTAGTNVSISGTTISATDTTYTAGTNIDITNNVISATGGTFDYITGSTNLNTVVNQGAYIVYSSGTSGNRPESKSGTMIVNVSGQTINLYYLYISGSTVRVKGRTSTNGGSSWGSWGTKNEEEGDYEY